MTVNNMIPESVSFLFMRLSPFFLFFYGLDGAANDLFKPDPIRRLGSMVFVFAGKKCAGRKNG
jgi:hypothetical protein